MRNEANGQWLRLTIDLRKLNAKTIRDMNPIGRIEEVINRCEGNKHYSTTYMQDAFWAIITDPSQHPRKSRHKLAFKTHNALLQWVRMPQGATNSGPIFTKVVKKGFRKENPNDIDSFMDDATIHTSSFQKQLYSWQRAYNVARRNNFKYKPSKTAINYVEIKLLVYIVSEEGRKIAPDRIADILKIREPTNVKELQQFLGQQFQPFQRLQQKGVEWEYGDLEEDAFKEAKEKIAKAHNVHQCKTRISHNIGIGFWN